MKKKFVFLILLIVFCLITFSSCAIKYEDAENIHEDYAYGYFTAIKKWNGGKDLIVYANDTCVMYYIHDTTSKYGITPLFNADGTLQVYKKE